MPVRIVRNDITKMDCDAIVNAANSSMLGGGGVDGAIHKAAGKNLLRECRTLGGCKTGEAKITGAYKLPCKYVIHTVGPVWHDGTHHEEELLRACYRNSLLLAAEYDCESVAFPLISAGAYGYPKEQALQVAVNEICSFLLDHDMLVYIVVFDKKSFSVSKKLVRDIEEFIDENYVEAAQYIESARMQLLSCSEELPIPRPTEKYAAKGKAKPKAPLTLKDAVEDIDESFAEMLFRKIDEKGMSDVECYKRANVDRKLFSKIRSNPHYKPRKSTAIAFAISLRLSLEETSSLLMKAGFALSHSEKFDIIIEFFISRGEYDIFKINEALFEFDQPLLG